MWNHRRQKRHDACMAGHRYLLSCTTKYWTTIVLSASTVVSSMKEGVTLSGLSERYFYSSAWTNKLLHSTLLTPIANKTSPVVDILAT